MIDFDRLTDAQLVDMLDQAERDGDHATAFDIAVVLIVRWDDDRPATNKVVSDYTKGE